MSIKEISLFRSTLYKTVLLPVSVVLCVTLLLTILCFNLFNRIYWADRSSRVIIQAQTCLKLTVDLETGLRGYFLSGYNPEFLEPYNRAFEVISPAYKELEALVEKNSDQKVRVQKIIEASNAWLASAKDGQQRHMRRSGSTTILLPQELTEMKQRKALMDSVRFLFDDFISTERQLQQERLDEVTRMQQALAWGGLLLLLVAAITIGTHVFKQLHLLNNQHLTALEAVLHSTRELAHQREWFRVILVSIGDAVLATDHEGRASFLNREAEKLIGWTEKEASNFSVTELIQIKDANTGQTMRNPVAEVLEDKKNIVLVKEALLVSRDGEEIPIQCSASPIFDETHGILGTVLVFHDSTVERKAQKALMEYSKTLELEVSGRTEHLRQAYMEMEAFSYTVSHDLRSPLRSMQGYAEAILEDYGERLDDKGRGYLERIKAAAERLDKLIQDLLTYTRVTRESTPLIPLDLDAIVRDMIAHYPNLQAPAVDVDIEGHLPIVLGRESGLTQIFSNLLGNAVKFVPEGVTPRVWIRAENRGNVVRIWIEDNGIGMDPVNHERAFRIFEQLNNSKLYTGTGVGLAITKKAVESLNGQIGIISELGQGTRFWLDLCLSEKTRSE